MAVAPGAAWKVRLDHSGLGPSAFGATPNLIALFSCEGSAFQN